MTEQDETPRGPRDPQRLEEKSERGSAYSYLQVGQASSSTTEELDAADDDD